MEQSFRRLKICSILIHITDARRGGYMVSGQAVPTPPLIVKFRLMNTLQRLTAVTDTTASLIAQLRELNELREQVRKAELARRSPRLESRSQPTPPLSGNRRSVFPTEAVRTTSAASSRDLPKSRTAPRGFYISDKPVGKGAERD
jgi:hypothetical protein